MKIWKEEDILHQVRLHSSTAPCWLLLCSRRIRARCPVPRATVFKRQGEESDGTFLIQSSWDRLRLWDKSSFENHIGNGQSDKIWQAIVEPLDYDNLLTSIRTNAPLEPKVAFNSTSSSSSATEILEIWHLSDQGFLSWGANHTILYSSLSKLTIGLALAFWPSEISLQSQVSSKPK